MAPPGYRILKVKPTPARDTANTNQRTLWRMNPDLDEPFDPARCLDMTDNTKDAPVDSTAVNTSNLSEHIISTPKTGLSQVGIGQKPSESDPLGIANVTPAHLACLIASTTARNLNKPGGGLHASADPSQGNAQTGYSLPESQNAAEGDDAAMCDDPRINTEIFQAQNKARTASGHSRIGTAA
eukprot:772758-Pleurochrysis_carterae.AAC.1